MLSTGQLYRRTGMTAVGIDVGKASLDVAIEGRPRVMRVANSAAGIRKLVRQLAQVAARIVVEATGGYEEPLLEACCDVEPVGGAGQSPPSAQLRPCGRMMWPRPMPSMPGCCA